MKELKKLIDFKSADQIVENIMQGHWKSQKSSYDPKYDENVLNSRMEDNFLSMLQKKERLRPEDALIYNFPGSFDKMNNNRISYSSFHAEECVNNLAKSLTNNTRVTWKMSGIYHTPPKGLCGWHHNGDADGDRIYLVWCEEADKSYFKWQDPVTKKIHTTWEKKGWNINHFIAPSWHGLASWTNRISIGLRQGGPGEGDHYLYGSHICRSNGSYGDWTIDDKDDQMIKLTDILHLLTADKLQTVRHKEICWKGMDDTESVRRTDPIRYLSCNINIPGILIKDCKNPKNMKYRMIDGKHRMSKMKHSLIEKSIFFVLEYNDIKDYIQDRIIPETKTTTKNILTKIFNRNK